MESYNVDALVGRCLGLDDPHATRMVLDVTYTDVMRNMRAGWEGVIPLRDRFLTGEVGLRDLMVAMIELAPSTVVEVHEALGTGQGGLECAHLRLSGAGKGQPCGKPSARYSRFCPCHTAKQRARFSASPAMNRMLRALPL